MQSLAKFRPWVVSFRLAVSGPKICIPNVWTHLRLHHHSNMALLFNVLSFYFAQLVGRMYTLKQSYSRPLISLGGACIYSFSGLLLEVLNAFTAFPASSKCLLHPRTQAQQRDLFTKMLEIPPLPSPFVPMQKLGIINPLVTKTACKIYSWGCLSLYLF